MRRLLLVTPVVGIAMLVSSAQAQMDHLTCYKAKDSASFAALATLDSVQDAFDPGQCQIVGKAKLFCVPTSKALDEFTVDKLPAVPLPVVPAPVPALCVLDGAPAEETPDPDSTIGDPVRSGVVTTPPAPATAASCVTAVSPGAASRSTCPTRITLTFSMLFHAARSR